MKIGMNLPVMVPGLDRDTIRAWCRAIDDGPFSCLAIGERICFPNPELTVTLSFAAAVTERVPLLYNVMVLPMHDPVQKAKEIATLDVLSGGRVKVGLGVGGRQEDYEAVGASYNRKALLRRLESGVDTLKKTWAQELPPGSPLRPVEPQPLQRPGPPLLSGALFPQSLRRSAAWADGLAGFSFGMQSAEVKRVFGGFRKGWEEAGREGEPYLATGGWFSMGASAEEEMDAYLERYLNFLGPMAPMIRKQVPTTSDQALRDAVARMEDLGADEVILAPTTADVTVLARVADVLKL